VTCDILHEEEEEVGTWLVSTWSLVGTWLGGSVDTSLSCDILHEEVALVGT